MRLKQTRFIDDKHINLATVYLKHIQFNTIPEIWPVSFMTDKYTAHYVY